MSKLSVRLQAYLPTNPRTENGPGDIFLDYMRDIGTENCSHAIRQLIMEFYRFKYQITPALQQEVAKLKVQLDQLQQPASQDLVDPIPGSE